MDNDRQKRAEEFIKKWSEIPDPFPFNDPSGLEDLITKNPIQYKIDVNNIIKRCLEDDDNI